MTCNATLSPLGARQGLPVRSSRTPCSSMPSVAKVCVAPSGSRRSFAVARTVAEPGVGAATIDALKDYKRKKLFDNWEKALMTSVQEKEADCWIEAGDIEGELPAELQGTLYKVGPALFERDGVKVNHCFDGDGAVHSFKIEGRRVRHRSQFVKTEGYLADEEAGRFACRGAYSTLKPAQSLPLGLGGQVLPNVLANAFDLNFKNTSNITVLEWAGRLVVGWNDPPYVLDPETLDTRGVDTFRGVFSKDDKVQSHFALDEERDRIVMFAVNTANPASYGLKFYEFGSDLELLHKRECELPFQGGVPILHDIAVTEDYIVMFQAPLKVSNQNMLRLVLGLCSLNEVVEFDKEEKECALLVVPRNPKRDMKVIKVPNSWTWHIVSATQRTTGGEDFIDLHTFTSDNYNFKSDFTTREGEEYVFPKLTKYEVDVSAGRASSRVMAKRNMEMPDCGRDRNGVHFAYALSPKQEEGFAPLQSLVKLDLTAEDKDVVAAVWNPVSDAQFLSEPTFVARQAEGAEGSVADEEGWVLSLCHDVDEMKTTLLVFDAKQIDDGPIARVPLGRWLPWVFHGAWSTGTKGNRARA